MEEVERRRERAAEEVVRSMEPEPTDAQERRRELGEFVESGILGRCARRPSLDYLARGV